MTRACETDLATPLCPSHSRKENAGQKSEASHCSHGYAQLSLPLEEMDKLTNMEWKVFTDYVMLTQIKVIPITLITPLF